MGQSLSSVPFWHSLPPTGVTKSYTSCNNKSPIRCTACCCDALRLFFHVALGILIQTLPKRECGWSVQYFNHLEWRWILSHYSTILHVILLVAFTSQKQRTWWVDCLTGLFHSKSLSYRYLFVLNTRKNHVSQVFRYPFIYSLVLKAGKTYGAVGAGAARAAVARARGSTAAVTHDDDVGICC